MSTLVFTRRACLEGRRDKSTSIELCASMVAKLECHLINTRFKLPHLSFLLSRRLVRDFGSIVSVLVGVVDDGGHNLAVSGAVGFQLVGDQPPGRASLPLQQLAEESFSGFPITAKLDEDIEHITILIYRAPEVLAFALVSL